MKCADDGSLRAFVDGELATTDAERLDQHLRACATCRTRAEESSNQAHEVRALVNDLGDPELMAVDPELAYHAFRAEFGSPSEETSKLRARLQMFTKRPVWGGVAAAAALVVLLSFAPARTWAQKFLQMLRVQKVTIVPVDLPDISSHPLNDSANQLVAQFISDNVVVTMKPGAPVNVASATEASTTAGFAVKTLDALGSPSHVSVAGPGAFHMTLDVDKIRALLEAAGRSDIQVPNSVTGSTVAVYVPKSVHLSYGNCTPDGTDCVRVVEVPSPTVSVPPGMDMMVLGEAVLQIMGMNSGDAHAFAQSVDWSYTLVVPVPRRQSTVQPVSVDGATGTLIEVPATARSISQYDLFWVKDGVLFSVSGRGDASEAISAANAMN